MNKLTRFFLGYAPACVLRRAMQNYDGKLKQIIILRTDLNMRRGKEIAQGAHSSMGAYLGNRRDPFVRMWLQGAFAKIAVGIRTEEEMLDLHQRAKEGGLAPCLIQDSGRTEFKGVPTYTSLTIGPGEPEKVAELTQHLKLR